MTGIERHRDPKIQFLVDEGRKILNDPEQVYDLAGKRLMLRVVELNDYFKNHSVRIGIVGRPDRGKSTYAFSCFRSLELRGLPTQYVDLDIYSNSGLALQGIVKWDDRPKRPDAPKNETLASINAYKHAKPGVIFGDFPGWPDNPYQGQRVRASDMAVVLGDDAKDRDAWFRIVSKTHKPSLWLRTRKDNERTFPIDPTVYNLNRIPRPNGLDIITSLTRILEVIAKQRRIPLIDIWKPLPDGRVAFSDPEQLILREFLDFEFAPYAAGEEWD